MTLAEIYDYLIVSRQKLWAALEVLPDDVLDRYIADREIKKLGDEEL